jgi:cell division protein FtsL
VPVELNSPKAEVPSAPIKPISSGVGKKKRRISGINVLLTILIIAAGVFTIPCCITQHEKNNEADKLVSTLESEKNKGARLRIEYEIRTDYKLIEEYVTHELMMKKLEPYQMEYVLRDSDSVSVVLNTEGYDENFFTMVSKTFSLITEYFN